MLDADRRPWLLEVQPDPVGAWSLAGGEDLMAAARDLAAGSPAPGWAALVPSGGIDARRRLAVARPADVEAHAQAGLGHDDPEPHRSVPGLRSWALGEELVVHAPHRRELHVLDPTAAYLLSASAEGLAPDAIADELHAATGSPLPQLRAAVYDELGAATESGLLARGPGDDAPRRERAWPPPLRAPHVRWNQGRTYSCAGSAVAVHAPERLWDWLELAIGGLAIAEPAEIAAVCEVVSRNGGWTVQGTHHAPLSCRSEHSLPALVRWSILTSGLRTSDLAAVDGTALLAADGAVVVLGDREQRVLLALAWLAQGERLVADDLVAVGHDRRVQPVRAGMVRYEPYQWIDGAPRPPGAPGAPLVDRDGWLVRWWIPPASAVASAARPVSSLVVLDPAAAAAPLGSADALRHLLPHRPRERDGVGQAEAEALVALAEGVPCRRAGDPEALVRELRAGRG
jgi:hypothetical protein